MSNNHHNRVILFWNKSWQWLAIFGLGLATLILGYIGFMKHSIGFDGHWWHWSVFYRTIQLFVMESGAVSPPVPWELNCARFLAPIVPAWTVVKALAVIFRDQLRAFRLRFIKNHVVICGLGRKGLQLVKDFRENGTKVVVIEIDAENSKIEKGRDLGAVILNDKSYLEKTHAERASCVIAITGDDGTNVNVAILTLQLVHNRSPKIKEKVCCYVHVCNLKLATLLRGYSVLLKPDDSFEARIFNMYQNSARILFENHPLDYDRFAAGDPRLIHLMIVGFGTLGESVLIQAAKIGHYANGRKIRVSVIDKLDDREKKLYGRYPKIKDVCDIEFKAGEVEDAEVLDFIFQQIDENSEITTIVVCLDGDSLSLTAGLTILSKLVDRKVPIYVRMEEEFGLAALLNNKENSAEIALQVDAFGVINHACNRTILLSENLDLLSRAIHGEYLLSKEEIKTVSDPRMQDWDSLDEHFKDANRQQADHMQIKLRAIRCYSSAKEAGDKVVESFTDEEIEIIAQMEHARWCAGKYLSGWIPGDETDLGKHIHKWLRPWNELPNDIKQNDYDAVNNIPKYLALIGEKIYRKTGL